MPLHVFLVLYFPLFLFLMLYHLILELLALAEKGIDFLRKAFFDDVFLIILTTVENWVAFEQAESVEGHL